jgi:hypothetical protein
LPDELPLLFLELNGNRLFVDVRLEFFLKGSTEAATGGLHALRLAG